MRKGWDRENEEKGGDKKSEGEKKTDVATVK